MIKGQKYDDVIQKILDQCKIWSAEDRVGRFYMIGKFPFVIDDEYNNIECEILYDIAVSSELFDKYDEEATDYGLAKIKLNKEGYLCVSKHDWNYKRYLKSKKSQQRDTYFKIGLVLISILLGIFASTIKGCIEHKTESQSTPKSECSHEVECGKYAQGLNMDRYI